MPSQAALAQEGMTIPLVENRARHVGSDAELPRVHIAPLVTRRASFSSTTQKYNPLYCLGYSSYMIFIFIEIESQQGALSYVVVGDRGGRTVDAACLCDRGMSRPGAGLERYEAH